MTRKIAVVVTARPSYGRFRSCLLRLAGRTDVQTQLVLAGSSLLDRYGNIEPIVAADGLKVDARVHMLVEGENLLTSAKTTGLGIIELSSVFSALKPDVVVTIADRYETLATSIAASYMNIPLAHIQGGEVTGNIDEKVRHANTKLADLHLVASERARERVIRMGEDPESVFVTGCPSIDIAADVLAKPGLKGDLFKLYGGVGPEFSLHSPFLIILQHPVTTEFGQAKLQIQKTLEAVDAVGLPALWFWPNVDAGSDDTSKGLRQFREQGRASRIHFFKNMPPDDFLRICMKSACVVGNSSVAIRECSFLGVPAVNIGSRQDGRDRGKNVIDVGYDADAIQAAIQKHVRNGKSPRDDLYGRGDAGERIAEVLVKAPLRIAKRLQY
jgi:UDP-hydrolysing UDP-N-acetyl-D-glucosamine 2-epimerase